MKHFAVLVATVLVLSGCSPDVETTGTISRCVKDLFPVYNPKVMDQCVAACTKCDRGTITTCTTSCTLKGAH